jgi:predicted metal-binding membrane protein
MHLDKVQKIILVALVSISAASWLTSQVFQDSMMTTMMSTSGMGASSNNSGVLGLTTSYSFFVLLWTVGMAAMMFPAITPMVYLYNKLTSFSGRSQVQVALHKTSKDEPSQKKIYPIKTFLFVGGYLAVWSLTGFVLLFGWSTLMTFITRVTSESSIPYIYGAILIVAGAYQFSSLKTRCLGYCESPLSFFMRRWSNGVAGAAKMGIFHGLYCLGCCWPYFLLMVALGWMNLLWMALFSGIIFGEKLWSKGVWVARAAGIGLVTVGILVIITGGSVISFQGAATTTTTTMTMPSGSTSSTNTNMSTATDSTPSARGMSSAQEVPGAMK